MYAFIEKELFNIYSLKVTYSHPDTSSKVVYKTATFDDVLVTSECEVSAEGEALIEALWEGNTCYHDLTIEATSIFDMSDIEEVAAFYKQVIVITSYYHGIDNEVVDCEIKKYNVVAEG